MLRLALLALTGLALVQGLHAQRPTPPKLRALLIDGRNNHEWVATTPILKRILEHSGRFAVDVATAPKGEAFAAFAPDFARYDVVVSNYNGETWPAPMRAAFEAWVRGGGGFVSVHAADNAFPEWEAYNRMIGLGGWGGRSEASGPYLRWRDGAWVKDGSPGRGGSHGRQHEFVLEARAPEHPILQGLPTRWRHTQDELYDRLRGPAEELTVLASAFSSQETGGSDEHEPLLMTIAYGQGRVFHTALGHAAPALYGVGFQVTLARGAEWAATGEVQRPDVPFDFPTEDEATFRRSPAARDEQGRIVLFDGRTLGGWQQVNGSATYHVEDGAIVGETSEGSPNSFLFTHDTYGDFELWFEVKLDDDRLNSGCQVRSHSLRNVQNGRVHGYQVEIAANGTAGFVYDEARSGWLSKDRSDPAKQAAFRSGEWNRYRVRCVGDSLRTWINDVPVADVVDERDAAGFIGLQVHSIGRNEGPYRVRWRHLFLKEL